MWTSTSHISLVNATPNTVSLICRLLIVKIMLDIFELLRRIIRLWPGSNEFLDCVSKIVSFSQRVQLCLSFFTFTIEGLILLKSQKRLMTKWQPWLFFTNLVNDSIHYIPIVLKIYCNNQEQKSAVLRFHPSSNLVAKDHLKLMCSVLHTNFVQGLILNILFWAKLQLVISRMTQECKHVAASLFIPHNFDCYFCMRAIYPMLRLLQL